MPQCRGASPNPGAPIPNVGAPSPNLGGASPSSGATSAKVVAPFSDAEARSSHVGEHSFTVEGLTVINALVCLYLRAAGFTSFGFYHVMAQARIPVPNATDPLGTLTLTAAVAKGIATKGPDSLIVGELAAEVKAVAAKIPAALAAHDEAKQLQLRLEKLYEQRDAVVAECVPLNQRGSKALQGNLGKTRLREMGDYGYTVDDSAKAPKA